jgi:general transcription factor 3C polypeptide 5 (transcription factor C subunit 1)
MDGVSSAPILQITPREVVAVEHPMIIKNIDKGLKTFGNGKPFERVSLQLVSRAK